MIKKHTLLILITLFFALLLSGAVSAADIYVNGSNGNDDNDGLSWDTAKLSIGNATATVSENGVVSIADGEYSGINNTNITISKSMTINGLSQNGVVINGSSTSQIFKILSGVNVTLKNITFTQGLSNIGGAICNYGNLTVENCTFLNNQAVYISGFFSCGGGAIFNNEGIVAVSGSTFTANTANPGEGGAIWNDFGTMVIENCTFNQNTALKGLGGAFFSSGGTASVGNSLFTDNRALIGGAICNYNIATLTVNNTIFNHNTAISPYFGGGAIYNSNAAANIHNSTFSSNYANFNGGAIWNSETMTLSESTLSGNTAIKGGAIYNGKGTLAVENCNIKDNTALAISETLDIFAAGGGIFNEPDSTLTIDHSVIQSNIVAATGEGVNVSSAGGGIYNGGSLVIDNSSIQHNSVAATAISQLNIVSADGGGIYNDNIILINNSTIQNNTVTATADKDVIANGAGIFNNGDMTLNNSKIQYNSIVINTNAGVGAYGGGIQNGGNLYINNSTLQYNTISSTTPGINRLGGGAISNTFAGNLYIDSSIIAHNAVAAIDGSEFAVGGGIYNENAFILKTSTLAFNTVTATNPGKYAPLGGGVCNFGDMIANFNRIVNNSPDAIHNDAESVPDLQYNWWGSNAPEFEKFITGTTSDHIPWLVMRYTAIPGVISQGSTSTLIADFTYDSDGVFHDPSLGHLPDGTVVTFATNLGNVGSKMATALTHNGRATILLRGDEAAGFALTSAILDTETMYVPVTITAASVSAATNTHTISMQTTGTPLAGLILAILMISGGFVSNRKNR